MVIGTIWTLLLLLIVVVPARSQDRPTEQVDRLLERLSAYGYAGAVAVAVDGRVVHEAGYGLADREATVPIQTDTRFDIGSLTKPFTAALVLRLVEEGSLSLDDSLGGLLEEVPRDKGGITIHQLLTHTSGLMRSAASLDVDAEASRDTFLFAVLSSELLYVPGERFEYSDTGYDLLAAIAEIVTGEAYATLLERLVISPAGLEQTGYATDDPLARAAWSYADRIGVPWGDEPEGLSPPTWYNLGSGGLVSTVGDLLRFEAALRAGRIIPKALVDRMMSGHTSVSEGRAYGYGWFMEESPHGRMVYHGGDIAGYKAHLARYVDRGIVFAALGNVYGWERVADRDAIATWFGNGPALPPEAQPSNGLLRFEGTYRTSMDDPLVVWVEAGRLAVEVAGQDAVDLVFGVRDETMKERTEDARRILTALEQGNVAFVETRLRDRDRAAGMANQLLSLWNRSVERDGPVQGYEIAGSYPAQDGTVVTFIDIDRGTSREGLRLIWRADRLVSAGGAGSLRRPIALLQPTGATTAAQYVASSGETVTLSFTENAVRVSSVGRTVVAQRDRQTPIDPPPLSIVRQMLPFFVRNGAEAGLKEYDRLQATRPERYEFGEEPLNDLGYRLLHRGALQEAIAVFRRNVKEHPDSWNVHDSLGEALLAAGRVQEGRESYERSLQLNPDNEQARIILERDS